MDRKSLIYFYRSEFPIEVDYSIGIELARQKTAGFQGVWTASIANQPKITIDIADIAAVEHDTETFEDIPDFVDMNIVFQKKKAKSILHSIELMDDLGFQKYDHTAYHVPKKFFYSIATPMLIIVEENNKQIPIKDVNQLLSELAKRDYDVNEAIDKYLK